MRMPCWEQVEITKRFLARFKKGLACRDCDGEILPENPSGKLLKDLPKIWRHKKRGERRHNEGYGSRIDYFCDPCYQRKWIDV